MSKPTPSVFAGINRIAAYLNGTLDLGLVYTRNDSVHLFPTSPSSLENSSINFLEAWSDASWNPDPTGSSHSGSCCLFLGTPISWASRKQLHKGRSSAETELIAAAETGCEIAYEQQFFEELGLYQPAPITFNLDSEACIAMIANPINHKRNKHIDLRYFHIRDLQFRNIINPVWISTDVMTADIFTKSSLSDDTFLFHRNSLVHQIVSSYGRATGSLRPSLELRGGVES